MSDHPEKDIDQTGRSEPGPAENPPADIDEGPSPGPVDDIQAALFEAEKAGIASDLDFDMLNRPGLDADPGPDIEDDIQAALKQAASQGIATDVDFDTLPGPSALIVPPLPEPPPTPVEPSDPTPAPVEKPLLQPRPAPTPMAPAAPDFWLVLPLFVVFRLLTLFLLRPGGYIRDWSDFDTFFGISALSDYGLYPFLDFWLEWPPLVPWLAVGAYKLALNISPWPDDSRLWFILILGTVFLLFDLGNLILIHRIARRLFDMPGQINRVLWLYALLFPPVYVMLGYFDGVTLFFMLLALELILNDQRSLSAISVGVGVMVKVIPILMLPVTIRRIWSQHQSNRREAGIEAAIYIVVTGLTVILLSSPFLILGTEWVAAFLRAMAGRASWETVWAIVEGYYGFGVVAGDRLNPAETNFAVHQGFLPWWLPALLFGSLYVLLFLRKADYHQPRNAIAFGGLTISIFLLYNKGYSPQFLIYLLPFILLIMPNGRGVTYALILTLLNVFEQPLYFVILPDATWLLTSVVVARSLMFVLLAVEFNLALWPVSSQTGVIAHIHRYVPLTAALLAVLMLLILTPLSINAYNNKQNDSVVGNLGQFMALQSDELNSVPPRLLVNEQEVYRQLYPLLNGHFDLQLTDGGSRGFTGAATVDDLVQGYQRVWAIPTGPLPGALTNPLEAQGTRLAEYKFDDQYTVSLYSLERNPLPMIPPARFIGGIELLGHQTRQEQDAIEISLFWRAQTQQNQNLTVFTHLIDANGERVAGHDGVPRNGTAPVTGWQTGIVQSDMHRIQLPPDLPVGSYSLVAGLYNDSGERVRGIDQDGFGFADRAVPLEIIQFQ
jgi:hypothetical protein